VGEYVQFLSCVDLFEPPIFQTTLEAVVTGLALEKLGKDGMYKLVFVGNAE
jgi:hypothetical protein